MSCSNLDHNSVIAFVAMTPSLLSNRRNYKNADWAFFQVVLNEPLPANPSFCNEDDIDCGVRCLTQATKQAAEAAIGHHDTSKTMNLTPNILVMIRDENCLRRFNQDQSISPEARRDLRTRTNQLRNKIASAIKIQHDAETYKTLWSIARMTLTCFITLERSPGISRPFYR